MYIVDNIYEFQLFIFFSCTLPTIGAAGGTQEQNGLCILSQNIINQKMYLVLWFWMTFLIILTPICLIYRLVTIFFDCFRSALLMGKFDKIIYTYIIWHINIVVDMQKTSTTFLQGEPYRKKNSIKLD